MSKCVIKNRINFKGGYLNVTPVSFFVSLSHVINLQQALSLQILVGLLIDDIPTGVLILFLCVWLPPL